jgi:Ca-activated chloride channel homolog
MLRWLKERKMTAVASAGAVVFGGILLAQQPSFHTTVNLVHVIATVKSPNGDLVGALQESDFKVFENGIPQKISKFERQTSQPLSIALMIDASGSTAKDLKFETDSAAKFLNALLSEGNPADAVALYSFDYQITERQPFTRNYTSLKAALRLVDGSGGTSIYDAIFLASRKLARRGGRKVIVMISDGGDTTSDTDIQAALKEAQLADAVIYPIVVVPITNDAGRNTGGEHVLSFMAAGTGGWTFYAGNGKELDKAFMDIISDLRTQYYLEYYPSNVPLPKDPFHKIEVRVALPGLLVLARDGYYGDAESADALPNARTEITPERKKK